MNKLLSAVCLVFAMAATGCAPSTPTIAPTTITAPAARVDAERAPSALTVATAPAVHAGTERAPGVPSFCVIHACAPVGGANRQIDEGGRLFSLLGEVANFDGTQVPASAVSRLASNRVSALRPALPGDQRRAALAGRAALLASAERDVRRELEDRRRALARANAARREADLARLASTALADMPGEIALAANGNLADGRSPFDTRANWRPEPAALREETVRLRNVVGARLEADRRAVVQRQQDVVQRQQADLQRAIEMARADADRDRRERQNMRMIELRFGMMAGGRPSSPSSFDDSRTYHLNGRTFRCTTRGNSTDCF